VTLAAGQRLGPYEILGQIGAGGMGEVYRAKDSRLSREVAIKVLPATFSQDADRLRRFEQEAKAAGVLNHPNITAVYDIGTAADGAPYVVQELLVGETLRSALAVGRPAPRRALDYATQIARGLAAAHEKGIVHRDLKPENVFVTRDGRVKILDFGLAKLTQAESAVSSATNLPTETRGTEPGVVLGTLGYMSPEQVRGKSADARSDIFSFGSIFYEMLSGRRAFQGDSAADTMSAILKEDPPDLSVTNQNVSPGLERIVRHCLEKNPEQRFQSASDLAFDIEAASATSGAAQAAPESRARRIPRVAGLLASLLAGAALAWVLMRGRGSAPAPAPQGYPMYRRLTNLAGAENSPTLSPDGQTVAFVFRTTGPSGIWSQRAGGRNPINLTPSCDRESACPSFSPDGTLIAYGSRCGEGGLFLVGATGESSRRLTSFGYDPAWSPDGREIVFSTDLVTRPYGRPSTGELWIADVAAGKTRKLFGGDAVQPNVSPHGLRVAFWALIEGGSQRDIWTIPYKGLAEGERPVPVTQDAAVDWNPVWAPDGRTLYYLSNRSGAMNLWRVAIDEATGKPLGDPEPQTVPAREVGWFALARDGRHAVYTVRENTFSIERFRFDPANGNLIGTPEKILESSQEMADIDVSPDGKFIAFDSRGGAQEDLYLVEADGQNLRQLTDDAPRDRGPNFSPDGKTLAFQSDRSGRYEIWTVSVDGSGVEQLTKTTGDPIIEPHWSPDGHFIAVDDGENSFLVPLDAKGAAGLPSMIPRVDKENFLFPFAWTPDGTLVGVVNRAGDMLSKGAGLYTPGSAAVRLVPAPEGAPYDRFLTRARRGATFGNRFMLSTHFGGQLQFTNLSTGESRLMPHPPSTTYLAATCVRGTGTCYIIRSSDNADIWQVTWPGPKK
jgi:serine/threonine protein kinase/sugar lactone lactonase YvrE